MFIDPNRYELASDAARIQAAVDEARASGGAVRIPRINARTNEPLWEIDTAIELHSGSVVYLDNCHLRLADGVFCNIFKNSHARTPQGLTPAGRQYDIRILGLGNAMLDGGNHNGLHEWTSETEGYPNIIENTFVHLHNVERFAIENLRVVRHRWWGVTCHYCAQGRIANLAFACEVNLQNMDGVDLRTGCHDILIENLTGSTGDDMVALTNIPYCARYDVAGLDTAIHSVTIRNIRAKLTGNHALVRLLNQGGRQLYNVLVDGVTDLSSPGEELHRPYAAIRIGDMFYNYDQPMAKLGDTRGIILRNVMTRAQNGVYAACTLQDALIDGVQLFGDAGTGLCFNCCQARNITLRNMQYGYDSRIPASDRGRIIQTTDDRLERLCGIYFHRSDCEGLTVDGLTMGRGGDAVVGGDHSRARLRLTNLAKLEPELPMLAGDGIEIEP